MNVKQMTLVRLWHSHRAVYKAWLRVMGDVEDFCQGAEEMDGPFYDAYDAPGYGIPKDLKKKKDERTAELKMLEDELIHRGLVIPEIRRNRYGVPSWHADFGPYTRHDYSYDGTEDIRRVINFCFP